MSVNPKFDEIARRVPLFNGLSSEDVAKIFSKGMTMTVEKGNVIFYQGTTGNQMYVVLGGRVELYDRKKLIATLRTGDLFGEMAVINGEPRSASAVASETARLFVLSETVFQRLMEKRVAIRILLNVIGTMSRRLRDMNTKLIEAKAKETEDVTEQP
ncbi:MAG: cyclic nucleotide-binding domain-containing protein [Candidatus Hydrogenedentes bacterium]|nr:cyclic nucleotide-binding domain-containing protein [Candidatus Hydrogenedentota bacterium]